MQSDESLTEKGLALYRNGRYGEAAAVLRHVLDEDPGQMDALHLLALVHKTMGHHPEALALFEQALRMQPSRLDARLNLALFLKAKGRIVEAKSHIQIALAFDPKVALAWQSLGTIARESGSAHYSEALRYFERAIANDPQLAETYYQRGIVLRQMARLEDAISDHRMAIRKGFDGPSAYFTLGNSLLEIGDEAGGLVALQTALSIAPASSESWYSLGNLLYAAGNSEGALAAYQRSEQLGLPMARIRVASMLVDLCRYAEAETELKRLLQLPGADVGTGIELLYATMVSQDRQEDARELFLALSKTPLAGRIYASECLTGLAALDLAAGEHHAAAAKLAGLVSDNCWLFSTRSLAALNATLDDQGQQIVRPDNRGKDRPRIHSTTLGTRGRFAHNVLEYIMLRLYSERYGYELETPDWVGGLYFDINEPRASTKLPPWLFARHSLNALVHGRGEPRGDRDILSPLFLFNYSERFRARIQQWLKPRAQWLPKIEPAVTNLRSGGRTVVALHIRRGDFLHFGYPITRTDLYVAWLRELWPSLVRPVLYLASDDLPAVYQDFVEFQPQTFVDVAPPWPDLEYLQDFHVLTQADVVGISAASGFSQLAARLNQRAHIIVQPDIEKQQIVPFIPWTDD